MFEITESKQIKRSPASSNRAWNKNSRVHVFIDGESVISNLINRRSRPRQLYRDVVLNQRPDLAGHMKWSQTAGCSCGCSPGFIVDHTIRDDGTPVDLYITAKFR